MQPRGTSKKIALAKIREQIGVIPQLRKTKRFSDRFIHWKNDTIAVIELVGGVPSMYLRDFHEIKYTLDIFSAHTPDFEFDRAFMKGLDSAAAMLTEIAEGIEKYWPDDPDPFGTSELPLHGELTPFIDPNRLEALRSCRPPTVDLARLIRITEEINICYTRGALHAVAALTRALLDHVPPIFGVKSFSEVANNYNGGRSFRLSMEHLQKSARLIGDAHLHTHIRRRESLPTRTQVNFANDLDVLLAEIVRILEEE